VYEDAAKDIQEDDEDDVDGYEEEGDDEDDEDEEYAEDAVTHETSYFPISLTRRISNEKSAVLKRCLRSLWQKDDSVQK